MSGIAFGSDVVRYHYIKIVMMQVPRSSDSHNIGIEWGPALGFLLKKRKE